MDGSDGGGDVGDGGYLDTGEDSAISVREKKRTVERRCALGFELVGQYQICVADGFFIRGHHIFAHIQTAEIAHDGVQNWVLIRFDSN